MRKSERQFRGLLEKLPAGAYTCDRDGLITYFNQHAERLWGRAPRLNDPVDRFCGSFKLFSTDGVPIAHDECWMAMALKMNREYNGHEIMIQRPDGHRFTALAHANPIHDDSGNLLGAVNVLVDISERKLAEDSLKHADRAKNEFLATLAHELRNPLAPIRNAVHFLHLQGTASPEMGWALDIIDRQTQQMTRLVDDLLDLGRITGNKLELRKTRITLAEVVETAVETSRPRIEANSQDFVLSVAAEPIFLDGDLTRLTQVISNLLNNAAKFSPRDGRISLTAERQGNDAVVTVRDTGIGIAGEMLPYIFDMFTQAHQSSDRVQDGLGIGLTLAKRFVEMHGGTIMARSAGSGQGSELIVRLPVVLEPSERAPGARHEQPRATAAFALRILIVDDLQDAAATLGKLLHKVGGDVRIAHDGLEAVRAAEEFRPDVVLLDIGLPKMDGYEAARAIRQTPWGREMVLIALTGWGQDEDRQHAKDAGFDHHLVKPLSFPRLVELLEQAAKRPAPIL